MLETTSAALVALMAPDAAGFLPHGYCYLWNKPLLAMHVASDLLIGASYVAISFSLAWLVHRARRDIPFSIAFIAFGLFIVTCGVTHFVEVWTLWEPAYWFSGGVKVVTALASVGTAVAMPFWIPRVHSTIRDAKASRRRELAEARATALEESNRLLQRQAVELEQQREEAEALAEELEETNEQLRLALMEAEAAQASADQARQAAEAANRVKSEFLAVMSHELRTPLNAVIGYTELMMMGLPDPVTEGQVTKLGRIRGSAAHLVGLVEQVLGFARIEAGTGQMDWEVANTASLAHEAVHLAEPLALAKDLHLEMDVEPGDLMLRTDGGKVRQVLLNLLSNGIKFTASGGVRLRVIPGPASVTFQVQDTGIGIAAHHYDRIFEPFWQVEQGHTRERGGTGLGLAVVRELVHLLGGTVSVRSEEGSGSLFEVTLPRNAAGDGEGSV